MGVKVKIVGSDIFTNKKYESVVPGDSTVQVPVVTKKEYQLIAIDDGNYVSLMDNKCELREDFELPEGELGKNMKRLYEKNETVIVQTIQAIGHEQITGFRVLKD